MISVRGIARVRRPRLETPDVRWLTRWHMLRGWPSIGQVAERLGPERLLACPDLEAGRERSTDVLTRGVKPGRQVADAAVQRFLDERIQPRADEVASGV